MGAGMGVWYLEDWFPEQWELLAALGGLALAVALLSLWAERRRFRRKNPDAVGCMPWTLIYLITFLAACVLLGLAAREAFRP